jgi:hypothetical protein
MERKLSEMNDVLSALQDNFGLLADPCGTYNTLTAPDIKWSYFPDARKCFGTNDMDMVDWFTAQDTCLDLQDSGIPDAKLAQPTTVQEFNFLKDVCTHAQGTEMEDYGYCWYGLRWPDVDASNPTGQAFYADGVTPISDYVRSGFVYEDEDYDGACMYLHYDDEYNEFGDSYDSTTGCDYYMMRYVCEAPAPAVSDVGSADSVKVIDKVTKKLRSTKAPLRTVTKQPGPDVTGKLQAKKIVTADTDWATDRGSVGAI